MTTARRAAPVRPLAPQRYMPTAERPLHANLQHFSADTRVVPHRHDWAQLAMSAAGVVRLTVEHGTDIVPPSRAVWVPPGVEHAVTVLDDADLLTLYLHQPRGRCGPQVARALEAEWRPCRVLEVSDLLRALCEAVLDKPTLHTTLDGWAFDSGASRCCWPVRSAWPRARCRWRRSPPSSVTPARAPSARWCGARWARRRATLSRPDSRRQAASSPASSGLGEPAART